MRLYLAGPMSNVPHFNFPRFDSAASLLREEGHHVVSPAELDDPRLRDAAMRSPDGDLELYVAATGATWGEFLQRDLSLICSGRIDAIVVLLGWRKSRGASLEVLVAASTGLRVFAIKAGLLCPEVVNFDPLPFA